MCCQSLQCRMCPCSCHVLSLWLSISGLMFRIFLLLDMFLLHRSYNYFLCFLCCFPWSVLLCCGLIWFLLCLACICNLFLLCFCWIFYAVCRWEACVYHVKELCTNVWCYMFAVWQITPCDVSFPFFFLFVTLVIVICGCWFVFQFEAISAFLGLCGMAVNIYSDYSFTTTYPFTTRD